MTIFFFYLQEYKKKKLIFYYSGVFSEQSVLGNNHLAVWEGRLRCCKAESFPIKPELLLPAAFMETDNVDFVTVL